MDSHINSVAQLRALYDAPTENSVKKQTNELNDTYQKWLSQSCFFVIASVGADGVDCTPRGDAPGQAFHITDNKTILIPDRRGNNRLDTLTNIVNDPRIALLFFIPGIEQTLRVIGQAIVSTDPLLLGHFSSAHSHPSCCIKVSVEAVYFQNTRALARSALWRSEHALAADVPTPGDMIRSVDPDYEPGSYDAG